MWLVSDFLKELTTDKKGEGKWTCCPSVRTRVQIPRTHFKSLNVTVAICNPSAEEVRTGGSLENTGQLV